MILGAGARDTPRADRIWTRPVPAVGAAMARRARGNARICERAGERIRPRRRRVIGRNPLVTSPGQAWRAFAMPYWPDRLGGGTISTSRDRVIRDRLGLVRRGRALVPRRQRGLARTHDGRRVDARGGTASAHARAHRRTHCSPCIPCTSKPWRTSSGAWSCMAAVFVLGALLAHRRGHRSAPLWLALGVFSKESAIVLIALAAANDVLLSENWRETLKTRRWWYASYGVVVLAYGVALAAVFRDRALAMEARVLIGTTALERMALVGKVIPHYARLLLAPAELSASYAPNVIMPDARPSADAMLGVAVLILVALACLAALRARRWPVMAFAMLWVPIALSPVSNVFFASGILLAERTLYLSSVGVCLGVGAIAERMLITRRTVALTTITVILVAFAARTWTRTPVWRDDRTWLVTLLADHPEAYEGHRTAGGIFEICWAAG